MPRTGFEPEIPATKRPQTYALDRAATGIGLFNDYFTNCLERAVLNDDVWVLLNIMAVAYLRKQLKLKIKLKLSHYMPWRRLAGEEI
jgi:hypothetical protein